MKKLMILAMLAIDSMTAYAQVSKDHQKKGWGLSSLIFTKLAEPDPRFEPALTLGEGLRMPQFGIGTYQMSNEQAKASVLAALRMGYRHIDTAHAYQDERGVGEAVKESGIPRQDLWLTSKLWPSEYGDGKTGEAIDKMQERLGTDYIDLLYVHQPMGVFVGGVEGSGEGRPCRKGACAGHLQLRRQRLGVQPHHVAG